MPSNAKNLSFRSLILSPISDRIDRTPSPLTSTFPLKLLNSLSASCTKPRSPVLAAPFINDMVKASQSPERYSKSPAKLSMRISAIRFAAPADLSMDSANELYLSSVSLTIPSNPDIASWPAKSAATCACSAGVKFLKPLRISDKISRNGRILPAESVIDKPNLAIAFAESFVGDDNRVSNARRLVPACSPLIPASAMAPIARAVS